jgi:predicted transport protein
MATPQEMEAAMVANMAEKTGKSLEQWIALAKKSGESAHGKIVAHLKSAHGLGHGYANLVAHRFLTPAGSEPAGDDLVEALYAGKKAGLRPIHDALMKLAQALGKDVEIAPKKTYVSLRAAKQFALVQPSTATRVDLGLNLKGVEPTARLEASGSFSAMCTHRVRLESVKDVDAEVKGWLKQAYESARS